MGIQSKVVQLDLFINDKVELEEKLKKERFDIKDKERKGRENSIAVLRKTEQKVKDYFKNKIK